MLFLYPFCLISTVVLGGSVLIDPTRSFATAGPPSTMRMLCSPIATSRLYDLATENIVKGIGYLPELITSTEQAQAIGRIAVNLVWRAAFEPIESECDAMLTFPLPPDSVSMPVPKFAVAIRDDNALTARLTDDAFVRVALSHQPIDHVAAAQPPSPPPMSAREDRPWCRGPAEWGSGCAEAEAHCATSAQLSGQVTYPAGRASAQAGVVVLNGLRLETGSS